MIEFILMLCIIVIFIRIYINRFDIQGKDIISVTIALILTTFLNLIQLGIDSILKIFL